MSCHQDGTLPQPSQTCSKAHGTAQVATAKLSSHSRRAIAVIVKDIMRLKHTSLALGLILLPASVGYPQAPQTQPDRDTPVFRVQVWGDIAADFSTRVRSYFDLRSRLEKDLPQLTVTDDPAEIRSTVRALAQKIRVARAEARQGDIFTPAVSAKFRKVLRLAMNIRTWAAMMDDNPGEFSARINGTYPERKTVSTVPPNILAALPRLPADIEYRFLGRHLILLDTRASVIIDRIPYAIPWSDKDRLHLHR